MGMPSLGEAWSGYKTWSSELGIAGRPGERDDVADVGHAGGVDDRPLEAQAEPGVGYGPEAPEVAVPAVLLLGEVQLVEPGVEHVEPLLALGAADDLADARGQHV